jgi:hypothetical protein
MPLPTDFADLPDESKPPETYKPSAASMPVTRMELHQAHKAINKQGMRQDAFEAKVDAMIPGADYDMHYDHHERIDDRDIESKKLWSEVRKAMLIGLILFVAGAITAGLLNYIKYGGGLK